MELVGWKKRLETGAKKAEDHRFNGAGSRNLPGFDRKGGARAAFGMQPLLFTLFAFVAIGVTASPALATQVHPAPEGLYAHQLAHALFVLSMGIFIYDLHRRGLTSSRAWRLLRYSALFFILWNLDAMLIHHLEGMEGLFVQVDGDFWRAGIRALPGNEPAAVLFWIFKMDHLLCVPAIMLLFAALRLFLAEARHRESGEAP